MLLQAHSEPPSEKQANTYYYPQQFSGQQESNYGPRIEKVSSAEMQPQLTFAEVC